MLRPPQFHLRGQKCPGQTCPNGTLTPKLDPGGQNFPMSRGRGPRLAGLRARRAGTRFRSAAPRWTSRAAFGVPRRRKSRPGDAWEVVWRGSGHGGCWLLVRVCSGHSGNRKPFVWAWLEKFSSPNRKHILPTSPPRVLLPPKLSLRNPVMSGARSQCNANQIASMQL